MNEIDKELGKRLLYFDGGMGTLLQGMGLSRAESGPKRGTCPIRTAFWMSTGATWRPAAIS